MKSTEIKSTEINSTETLEQQLQQTLRASEQKIDRQTLNALAETRSQVLAAKPSFFNSYTGYFSAGLATVLIIVAGVFPSEDSFQSGSPSFNVELADENIQLLLEDPDFLLWISNSEGTATQ